MKKSISQKGSAQIVLIAILLICPIAGAGYYVWTKQKTSSNDKTNANTSKTVKTTKKTVVNNTAYNLPKLGLMVNIPQGWATKETVYDVTGDGVNDSFANEISKGDWTVIIDADYGGKGGTQSCNNPDDTTYNEANLPICPSAKIVSAKQLDKNACLVEIDLSYPDGSKKRISKWDGNLTESNTPYVCSTRDLGNYDDAWGQLSDVAMAGSTNANNIPSEFGGSIKKNDTTSQRSGILPMSSVNDETYKEAYAILDSLKNY